MKKIKLPAVITGLVMLLMLSGCDKTVKVPEPPVAGGSHKPNFICENQPATTLINGQFVIYDLNKDDNKNKSYFIISMLPGLDSFTVIQAPRPIDSLALNWPAQVKSAGFGTSRNIKIDAKTRAISNQGDPWQYGAFNTANAVEARFYRNLNEPAYAGIMAGKKAYGYNTMIENYKVLPAYPGFQQYYREIAYYFKDGVYTDVTAPNKGVSNLDTLFLGASVIPWRNIDQVAQVITDNTYFLKKHFFVDWTNWKYYVVQEYRGIRSGTPNYEVTFLVKNEYSLNKLCKWPEGWGK